MRRSFRAVLLPALTVVVAGGLAAGPQFLPRPCADSLPAESVRCGVVVVPEDVGGHSTLALNVVIVQAVERRAEVPPLFHLEGGPGIAATGAAPFYVGPGRAYRTSRDVVLVDQRGTGASNPFRCPGLEHRSSLDEMYPAADVQKCRRSLEGIADLSSYSTERAAEDLDAVRQALGHSRIDLWALSYGTRLAQEYLRRFPSRVAHAVLAGFVPQDYRAPLFHAVNAQRAMDLLLFKCQSDESCSGRYPRLRAEWFSLLRKLRRASVEARDGDGHRVSIRGGPLLEAVRTLMGTAAGQRALPALIHAAAAGDFAPMLREFPKDSSQFAEGLYLTITCSEGVARIGKDEVERATNDTFLGDYRVRQEMAACAQWPQFVPARNFYDPLTESSPILVLAGEMDHVAPPDWGRSFCSRLPNCRLIEIPDLGHGPFDLDAWTHGECYDTLAISFYEDPSSFDPTCVRTMRPPPFR